LPQIPETPPAKQEAPSYTRSRHNCQKLKSFQKFQLYLEWGRKMDF